jgi:hypothetical protein
MHRERTPLEEIRIDVGFESKMRTLPQPTRWRMVRKD